MVKASSFYVCQQCGANQAKWSGQCFACGAWNSLVEEAAPSALPKGAIPQLGRLLDITTLDAPHAESPRYCSGLQEFDRVCGGGLVPGSVLLVGGDPGIGKSTLLLQITAKLSEKVSCAYVSGEEAVGQIRLRAKRLGVEKAPVILLSATNLNDVLATLDQSEGVRPKFIVIDSIQTMYKEQLDSAPGSVSQVRACAQDLIRLAKKQGITVVLVGHVTKEGALAGPRVLEHMVDSVLYFEGERGHPFRILRGVKNRFGATDEIGVFEMTQKGLQEVSNPSSLFLSERNEAASGSAIFAGIEGTRPILVEVQALVAPSAYGTPRRSVIGWDAGRLSMVIAVLETRCGVVFGARDIFLSVAGGLRIGEPAADLAVAAALLSSLTDTPLPREAVYFGEVGLSGEIRAVTQTELRLKEAEKLGFKEAVLPQSSLKALQKKEEKSLSLDGVAYLKDIGTQPSVKDVEVRGNPLKQELR